MYESAGIAGSLGGLGGWDTQVSGDRVVVVGMSWQTLARVFGRRSQIQEGMITCLESA